MVEPVLLMRRLGAEVVVLTNAAGGVNPAFGAGTLMVISDHINLTGRHPLIGPNAASMGDRFPDMTGVWDADLRARLHAAAAAEEVALAEGVYACLLGPSYETPAEVRMIGRLGRMRWACPPRSRPWRRDGRAFASAASRSSRTREPALSGAELSHAEVLAAAEAAGPRLSRVIGRFVEGLAAA